MGTPSNWERHSIKWERPVTGNAIPLNGNAGVGWGAVGCLTPPCTAVLRNAPCSRGARGADWALVSEPGFLKFQIFRFSILELFLFGEIILENYVGEISRNK